ncbi:MAG: peptidase M61 [Casimicrobiaceae bacterium]
MSVLSPTYYRVSALDPHAHLFEVRCTIDDPSPDGQRYRLPTWIPGSYLIREFARHFVEVRAENAAGAVVILKEAKDTWRVARCEGPLTVVAKVYAFELSVRTAYLDTTRGYFNGGALLVCPEGRENAPCTLQVVPPHGPSYATWRCATTFTPTEEQWTFRAADYDELIDHPVEMSDFQLGEFRAGGLVHRIAISGRVEPDMARLERDLARLCQYQIDLFGGMPPFPRDYLFQVMAVGDGYGGLEHRSSTSLLTSRKSLPLPGATDTSDDYVSFLGLASHEYFHAWNVKRIKPLAFTPYDLSRESYTRQLWVFEGITSYYDDLALVRSGVICASRYLELLGRAITNVLRVPGRNVQSIADASFDAWIKFYRADENSPNAGISYYAKGALVALALDLTLRLDGRTTLDDLMRALWHRYGEPGIGVPEDCIRTLASGLAGRDLSDFFARYVDGTEDPPLAELLSSHGIALASRAATGASDRGGKPATAQKSRAWLGAKVGADLKLQYVFTAGPAERAGLAAGDTLVAFDGVRASVDGIDTMLERLPQGTQVPIHHFRRDELMLSTVVLVAAPLDTAWLALDDKATDAALARRAAWLGTSIATA